MFDKFAEAIKEADSIVIAGHIRPDGDCYGSQMGLKEAIQKNFPEKRVFCVGSGLPMFFDLIGKMDEINDDIIANSLAIIVDLNELYRVEDQRVPRLAKKIIQIDHHIKMEEMCDLALVDESACSTCEIVAKLLESQKWEISEAGANALYLGIFTDSAHFEYVDNFPSVFKISAYLCELGAKPDVITRTLTSISEKTLKIRGYALTHYQKRKEGLIFLHLKHEQLEKLHISNAYASSLVHTIGAVKEYPIWFVMLEDEKHTCIMEFRSNTLNVCKVAIKYGGGGHLMAAGATVRNFTDDIKQSIINDLIKVVKGEEI